MGNWQLEVGKMALYMTFPVTLFYLFNQPRYFEEWVTKTKRELYPPDSQSHHEELQKFIKEVRAKQEAKMMDALKDLENKQK